jgi:DNA ligase-associated metallophosphoesterase
VSVPRAKNLQNKTICFAGTTFILDAAGCVYYPDQNMLIFADLHFEKGSYFAHIGNPLPRYDTVDTLRRIELAIQHYQPERIVCLGDNCHDALAMQRMSPADRDRLIALCHSVRAWHWLIGNHDVGAEMQAFFSQFSYSDNMVFSNFMLSHDLHPTSMPQIIGHFHPKTAITLNQQTIRGKCFVVTETLLMMPSFGTYTGGLDITSSVIQALIPEQQFACYLLRQDKIWQIK